MDIEKLETPIDLCQVGIEYALSKLAPDYPAVIILRIGVFDSHHAETVLEPFRNITGLDWYTIVESDYDDSYWSIECRDKMVYSEGT